MSFDPTSIDIKVDGFFGLPPLPKINPFSATRSGHDFAKDGCHVPAVACKLCRMQQRGIEVGMSTNSRRTREKSWVEAELEDSLDEELEMELDDESNPRELRQITGRKQEPAIDRRLYFHELLRLQSELVKLQDWVVHTKYKLVVIFEGRDAAGKGGVIKRITQRLNPRACRVVALPSPSRSASPAA